MRVRCVRGLSDGERASARRPKLVKGEGEVLEDPPRDEQSTGRRKATETGSLEARIERCERGTACREKVWKVWEGEKRPEKKISTQAPARPCGCLTITAPTPPQSGSPLSAQPHAQRMLRHPRVQRAIGSESIRKHPFQTPSPYTDGVYVLLLCTICLIAMYVYSSPSLSSYVSARWVHFPKCDFQLRA